MAKKKIVEQEIVNSTGDVKTEESSIKAPEAKHSVKVQIAFTDKYTDAKYKVGDLLENLSKERYDELINDPRKLVSKAY